MNMQLGYKKSLSTVIGIRMGNANSSISYINDSGKVIIITNEEGERQIPCVLSYLDGEEYHGSQAKAQLIRNSKNTITYFKNFFGKKIECASLHISGYSAEPNILDNEIVYTIISGSGNEYEKRIITLNEVMISHLKYLKNCAVEYIGKDVTDSVFSIPPDFSSSQIELLKKCAEKAGLNILQVIKEPVAEILAYSDGVDSLVLADKIFVVADFGEMTSSATVVVCRNGLYTILATETDYNLGGRLLDDCLIEYFVKEFQKKYNLDPKQDLRAMAKLRTECETTKKSLSSSSVCTISVECMFGGYDFYSSINRVRFEMLGRYVFNKMLALVKNVLKKAQTENFDIDEVILAGGSSHIPKILEMFGYIFPEKTLIRTQSSQTSMLSPSDIECYGTAIQASLISSLDKEDISDLINPNITLIPHLLNPIGIVIQSDDKTEFIPIIHSYTSAPVQRSIFLDKFLDTGDFCIIISQGTTRIHQKKDETHETQTSDDDDDDDSSTVEQLKVIEPSQKIAECSLKNIPSNAKIQVTIYVDFELKTTITIQLVSPFSAELVKGEIFMQQNLL
ncbi:unnamed protein product [Pneumocystis jirovecii]|uniref:Uncharacterized protein n=1 Tax=Pneumocystis jirovecii TaxID=42068 RepID=L0PCK1_PNEJI|nr:unnamed protein product [Pneumocystis jirovecii]